ncbi:MAG: cupin domain-containing protein [Proteobacteria bacterium]|jgi:mannose-6-phosphate isomerase-like protein (cupin superfamily)|nr:cupin domain-containing protein [Pseudomonadota bacterium]
MRDIFFGLLEHSGETERHWIEEGCFIQEILNHPEAKTSLARAWVPGRKKTSWHSVAVHECYLIESGHGLVELDYQTGFNVSAGDNVSILPHTPQRICNTGDQELVFLCLCAPRFTPEGYQLLEGTSINSG